MIQNLKIHNFKSFEQLALDLGNLNLLTGLNGSGKSSLIQALLMLRQSPEIHLGKALLHNPNNPLFDGGVLEDVYHQFSIEDNISIEIGFYKKKPLKWEFEFDKFKDKDNDYLESKQKMRVESLHKCNVFTKAFQYLEADRLPPQNIYRKSLEAIENEKNLGVRGEFAVHFLHYYGDTYEVDTHCAHPQAKSNLLNHQVQAWLGEISPNIEIFTEDDGSNEEVRLSFQYKTTSGKTNKFKPKNVGFGLSYVLPIIVSLLVAEKDKLIIIENPESHIHPRGQSKLGRLLALAAEAGAQLIIETHSDHILNGIRLAVAEKQLSLEKQKIFFFERSAEETSSTIKEIKLRENGFIDNWEEGFFDQFNLDLDALFQVENS